MKLENSIFEENYITSFSQVGTHDVLTNRSILSLMENLAGAHSAYCHYTFKDIAKDNLTWVILGWKLHVFKRPKADQKIKIQTWGSFTNSLIVMRDFKMFDEKGELCAIASSKWCLVNTEKGRIEKCPQNIEEIYHGFRDEHVFEMNDLPKITIPKVKIINQDNYKIRRFDLDLNKHVHNLNYLNYAYELLPDDIFDGQELNNVEIVYKREIKFGEIIKSFLYEENGVYTIVIKDEEECLIHSIIKLY